MKQFFCKYKHILPFLIYFPIYIVWFVLLEKNVTEYTLIHSVLDDHIPFIEVFVIPYYMWFGYVVVSILIAFFTDVPEYYRTAKFLISGMTIFLVISTFWPTGLDLRPVVMPRENIFTTLCQKLYSTDTATNVLPSIHVFNSIGCNLCINRCSYTKNKRWICNLSSVICTLIILSTMFIKQHSVIDVATALIMALVLYIVFYFDEVRAFFELKRSAFVK